MSCCNDPNCKACHPLLSSIDVQKPGFHRKPVTLLGGPLLAPSKGAIPYEIKGRLPKPSDDIRHVQRVLRAQPSPAGGHYERPKNRFKKRPRK